MKKIFIIILFFSVSLAVKAQFGTCRLTNTLKTKYDSVSRKVDKTTTAATFTGTVDLSKEIEYSNYSLTGALVINIDITKDSTGFARGIIIGNGTNTPTTRLTLWPGADSFDPTNLAQNYWEVKQISGKVYIAWKKLN